MDSYFERVHSNGHGRRGRIQTGHGVVETPFFMPIATKGSVKHILPSELCRMNASVVLGNTYHLSLHPGEDLVRSFGGLHKFMRWDGPILTDSGGFQVFSLGARFKAKTIYSNQYYAMKGLMPILIGSARPWPMHIDADTFLKSKRL